MPKKTRENRSYDLRSYHAFHVLFLENSTSEFVYVSTIEYFFFRWMLGYQGVKNLSVDLTEGFKYQIK